MHSCQAEIALDRDFITRRFQDRIHVFFPGDPRVEFIAVTPKKRFITLTVVGKAAEREYLREALELAASSASLSDQPAASDTGSPLRAWGKGAAGLTAAQGAAEFLRACLPPDWHLAAHFCQCSPTIPVSLARHPYADALVVIGDACAQRYLKNGLYSALVTAYLAAHAVTAEHGLSARALGRHFAWPCWRRYALDNTCGRIVFGWNRLLTRVPFLARAHLRVAWEEQNLRPTARRVVTMILWDAFTGNVPYAEILKDTLRPAAVWAIARATWVELWDRVLGRQSPYATGERKTP
jgi:hypothetical protein